jgi:hypothetical protein
MRRTREALKTLSTAWAAADHSEIRRIVGLVATVLVTTAVVVLASLVAVALSLT